MPGTAGSKYGIVHDDLPLKSDFKSPSPHSKRELKDLRRILRRKKSAQNKRKR